MGLQRTIMPEFVILIILDLLDDFFLLSFKFLNNCSNLLSIPWFIDSCESFLSIHLVYHKFVEVCIHHYRHFWYLFFYFLLVIPFFLNCFFLYVFYYFNTLWKTYIIKVKTIEFSPSLVQGHLICCWKREVQIYVKGLYNVWNVFFFPVRCLLSPIADIEFTFVWKIKVMKICLFGERGGGWIL